MIKSKDEILRLARECYYSLGQAIADEDADKLIGSKPTGPVLDENWNFAYRGYDCELADCISGETKNNRTDCYVCFIYDKRNYDGLTYDECPADEKDYWCPERHLIPFYLYGSDNDLKKGTAIQPEMLQAIDRYIYSVLNK